MIPPLTVIGNPETDSCVNSGYKDVTERMAATEFAAEATYFSWLLVYILLAIHKFAQWNTLYIHSLVVGVNSAIILYWFWTLFWDIRAERKALAEESNGLLNEE